MAGKKAETQDRIVGAAVRLFAERGYDRTSVDAIAKAAGLSSSAVFWHFGDKATLFAEVCRRMLVPFVEQLSVGEDDADPAQEIFDIVSVYERFVAEHRQTIETFVRWLLESSKLRSSLARELLGLQDVFTRKIERALAAKSGNAKAGAELAAGLVSALNGNLLMILLDAEGRDAERRRAGLARITALVVGLGEPSR